MCWDKRLLEGITNYIPPLSVSPLHFWYFWRVGVIPLPYKKKFVFQQNCKGGPLRLLKKIVRGTITICEKKNNFCKKQIVRGNHYNLWKKLYFVFCKIKIVRGDHYDLKKNQTKCLGKRKFFKNPCHFENFFPIFFAFFLHFFRIFSAFFLHFFCIFSAFFPIFFLIF